MKKLFIFLLATAMLFTLAACGNDTGKIPSGTSAPGTSGQSGTNTPGTNEVTKALQSYTLPDSCDITWNVNAGEQRLIKIGDEYVTQMGSGNTVSYEYYKKTSSGYEKFELLGGGSWKSKGSLTAAQADSELRSTFNDATLATSTMYGLSEDGTESLLGVTANKYSSNMGSYSYHPDYSIVMKVDTKYIKIAVTKLKTSVSSFEDAGVPALP